MTALADIYGLFFLGAFALYAVFYLRPLYQEGQALSPRRLKDLLSALQLDLAQIAAGPSAPEAASKSDSQAPPSPFDKPSYTAPEGLAESPILVDAADVEKDLFEEAAWLVVERQECSVSLIQREFDIIYAQAAEIVEELEKAGIVGPFDGSKDREVLIGDESVLRGVLQNRSGSPEADDDDAPEEEEEEERPVSRSERRRATERLTRLPSLRASYGEGVVQQAVDQIRAQYPDGAYQRFEVERLPAVAAFSERVGASRTMAGLFVLIGLFFTMIRLNGVVGSIASAAGGTQMNPTDFLDTMGGLMDGIGGAFDSSIFGLGLLIVALIIVGAIDWVAQRRVLELESAVTHQVVPSLASLQHRLMPNLTLADLLSETSDHLGTLGDTVEGLTAELDDSLSKLGDRIGGMMDDFKSFQQQYAQLDDLLKHMQSASKSLAGTAGALEGAARRVGDPLAAFNKTLLTHVETVVDWVDVSKTGFDQLRHEIEAVREHTDRVVEGLARAAQNGFGETLHEHQQAIRGIELQASAVEARLASLGDALRDATPENGFGEADDDA